jgi:hypothetical protein
MQQPGPSSPPHGPPPGMSVPPSPTRSPSFNFGGALTAAGTADGPTRIRARDMFMLMAMWMERFPAPPPVFPAGAPRPTGCCVVDPRERVLVLECGGEAHAIVRALLRADSDLLGADVWVAARSLLMSPPMITHATREQAHHDTQNKKYKQQDKQLRLPHALLHVRQGHGAGGHPQNLLLSRPPLGA